MPPTFLIGFMASGKSAAGLALAARGQRDFIDLDSRIEERAGRTIAELFDDGEATFRDLETDVLNDVIKETKMSAAVIATGGGAPIRAGNLAAMREAGLVVELGASIETLLARAEADGGAAVRPLLGGGADRARALHRERQSVYRQAHATVSTDALSAEGVAERIGAIEEVAGELAGELPSTSICALAAGAYPIVTRCGVLDSLGELVARFAQQTTRVGLVTDDTVGPLYEPRARAALESAGFAVSTVSVAAGEASKTPAVHARVADSLVSAGLDRRSTVVALGGGVVGDLAGYAAASLFRGVPIVQVPTTLLAMTDSAIGGKTGVNLPSGKNLLGAFWQPRLVVADPLALSTLPAREVRAGIGELYKYGLLDGEELYEQIDDYVEDTGDLERAERLIARCAAYKSWIVSRDEREMTGERALLNLGHTIGHAIERAAGYGQVLHGEAVALGLIAAVRVSAALGLTDADDLEERLVTSLASAGLDTSLDPWLRSEVLDYVGVDKKRTGSRIQFIAVRDVGVPEIAEMATADIAKILLPPSAT